MKPGGVRDTRSVRGLRTPVLALLTATLLAPAAAVAADPLVVSEDPTAARAFLDRKLGEDAPDVSGLPDSNRLAGLWILGTMPDGFCPTPSVTGADVSERLAHAQERIDELEDEAGLAALTGLRAQLGCMSEPVDAEGLWTLHFLEAVAASYAEGDPEPSLRRALAIRPGQAYDDSYPPELRDAYLQAQESALSSGRAMVVTSAVELAWLDGVPLGKGVTPVTPGEHLLQVQGSDGALRGGLVRLAPDAVTAVGTDGALFSFAQGLDEARRAALASSLAGGLDRSVWIVADGEVLALSGDPPDFRGRPRAGSPQAAPIFTAAVGGGWQMAGTDYHYGVLAIDADLRLVGPLRLMAHVRPSVGQRSEPDSSGRTWAPVLVAFGVGPVVRIEGIVRPRFGVALQLSLDRAPGADAPRLLDGVFGSAAIELPLGDSPLAVRPVFEAGFLGRNLVLRGLIQLEIGG